MLAELAKTIVIALLEDLKTEAISDIKNSISDQAKITKLEKDLNHIIEEKLTDEQENPHFNILSKMISESTVFNDYISRRINGNKTFSVETRVDDWAKYKQCTEEETRYLRSVAATLSEAIDECLMSNLSGETRVQSSLLHDKITKDIINGINENKSVVYNVNNVNNTYVTSNSVYSENTTEKCKINLSIGLYGDDISLSPESIQALKDYYHLDKERKTAMK